VTLALGILTGVAAALLIVARWPTLFAKPSAFAAALEPRRLVVGAALVAFGAGVLAAGFLAGTRYSRFSHADVEVLGDAFSQTDAALRDFSRAMTSCRSVIVGWPADTARRP
jgi:hypothetical protein